MLESECVLIGMDVVTHAHPYPKQFLKNHTFCFLRISNIRLFKTNKTQNNPLK